MTSAATFLRKVRRRALRETVVRWARSRKYRRIWIDVGAHEGELTFPFAAADSSLLVYAFEPNLHAASRIMGCLRNYVVLPIAIAERDGSAELQLNAYEQSSSLLPADKEGVKRWITEQEFKVVGTAIVPTMRLDTFMNEAGIKSVDYLKIDAQGLDLEVVKSAGDRLRDVAKVQLEATTASYRQYEGAPDKSVIIEYMESKGFRLSGEEIQSHGQEANLTFLRA
ncbi:MAG: FkbM family methyltransferase [Chloroflexi bacterium]|nr:MAG: FkbM family methyltransferase [Chloroflexota bacterium]TMG00506.1 MAG: FkbM family methyltransferase [Chloroflexota bacterium]